jgi:DNA ligase-associated metallophosphoesterase
LKTPVKQIMNTFNFQFTGVALGALPSGALFWREQAVLVVSDLHLGKSARLSAVGGAQLPPYETRETLSRLDADLAATVAATVICLGDSFDAPDVSENLPETDLLWLTRLQAGRRWIWIEGNHDPGPVALGGEHHDSIALGPLRFRHIADPASAPGEVSGHYHPKLRLNLRGRSLSRPCFLLDEKRMILPAYGAYTGGLSCDSPVLGALMGQDARAILTGPQPAMLPMPRRLVAG